MPGTYLSSLVKIASVTAEILLSLSLCGGWGGPKSFSCQAQLMFCEVELRLSWDFDNLIFEFFKTIVFSMDIYKEKLHFQR